MPIGSVLSNSERLPQQMREGIEDRTSSSLSRSAPAILAKASSPGEEPSADKLKSVKTQIIAPQNTSIDDLPDEVLKIIFKRLPVLDRDNVRLVSRRNNRLVKAIQKESDLLKALPKEIKQLIFNYLSPEDKAALFKATWGTYVTNRRSNGYPNFNLLEKRANEICELLRSRGNHTHGYTFVYLGGTMREDKTRYNSRPTPAPATGYGSFPGIHFIENNHQTELHYETDYKLFIPENAESPVQVTRHQIRWLHPLSNEWRVAPNVPRKLLIISNITKQRLADIAVGARVLVDSTPMPAGLSKEQLLQKKYELWSNIVSNPLEFSSEFLIGLAKK